MVDGEVVEDTEDDIETPEDDVQTTTNTGCGCFNSTTGEDTEPVLIAFNDQHPRLPDDDIERNSKNIVTDLVDDLISEITRI